MSLEAQLAGGLRGLGLDIDEPSRRRMIAHLELVAKWNRVHNLTAVRDPAQMVVLHLLDSLSLLPYLGDARNVLDVGSGPGFPGVPIAIARPEVLVTLLDANHKKCAFLQQARTELRLDNTAVACERVEHYRPQRPFDLVVSRAFADLGDFVAQSRHLVAPGGRLLAMKGVYPHEEIARLPESHRVARVVELSVPTLDAKRHLVMLEAA